MENKVEKLTGADLIAIERKEQIEKHGNTPQVDANLNSTEIGYFGMMPLVAGAMGLLDYGWNRWTIHWNKGISKHMKEKTYKEKLITAGALLAAEIDRLQYLEELEENK